MPEQPEFAYFLTELFPEAGPELLHLFERAAEDAALLRSDFYTIRDWLEIADYRAHDCLPALLLVMLLALEEGSFCVELTEDAVGRRLTDLAEGGEARAWARRLLAALGQDPCARLIGASPQDHKPLIRYTAGDREYLYFQKYLKAELSLHEQLGARLDQDGGAVDPGRLGGVLRDVLVDTPLPLPGGEPLRLDREQQWALGVALSR